MTNYRDFDIEICVGKDNLRFYRISGNGLCRPINDGKGEETHTRAVDKAKEFIDEHLVAVLHVDEFAKWALENKRA